MNNSIPDGWEYAPLGDFVIESVAGEWGNEAKGDENDIPVLRSTNFTKSGLINFSKLAFRNIEGRKRFKKALRRGDTLLEKSGGSPAQPVGRVVYFDKDTPHLYSNFTQKIAPVDSCDSKYFFYKLYFEYQNGTVLKFQQQTTGIINFQLAEYLGYKTIFPPLPEQQKIATILSSVDNVIEATRAQIDKLKDLKTGMMQELLTKGIGVDGVPHTEFKDSPVGRIPVGWEVGTLESFGISILDGDRGKEYPKERDFNSFEYCLFLSAKNVTKKGFAFFECSFITREKDAQLRKGKLSRGDIVITTRGTVGNIAYYDSYVPYENIRINSGMAIIRNKSTDFDERFLNLLMNSPLAVEQIELLAFGSAQPQLTISIIKGLQIPKPSLEEQKMIARTVESVGLKLKLTNEKLDTLNAVKKALMQDLLIGKVRVNIEEKEKESVVA
jgi:type I restriction enzyme S subunit